MNASAAEQAGVAWFADPCCAEHAVAGGKGANLARLTAAGFDVPAGFVLTVAAYEAHIAPFRAELLDAIDALPVGDPPALEAAAASIRARIEAGRVPAEVAGAVNAAYAALGGGYVAVRSSGTAEDLAGAAFAGLHDTYLDVRGEDELLDAVRRNWASVWTARAIAYRRERGFVELPSIAVVVQTMVEADVAGVLFTANPLTRTTSQLLVNANWGLGESVVQGITAPDQFVVEHGTFAVIEVVVGEKDREIVRDPATGRGVIERAVDPGRRSARTLTDAQLHDLARVGAAIHEHHGAPQDIEWALEGGRLQLLQARPITGVTFDAVSPDFAASPVHVPGHSARWTTANVDEGLPGTLTPLTWSMYFPPTESTMRDCWVALGVFREADRPIPDDVDGRFFSCAYGHAIANVDLMGGLAARVPGGSAAQMEEQLFGAGQGGAPPALRGRAKIERWPMVIGRLPRALRRAMRDLDPLAADIAAWWDRTAFVLDDVTADQALAALLQSRVRFEEVLLVHMVLAIASQGVLGQVETLAARAGHPGLERELIRSEQGTAEFDLVRDLWRLARDELTIEAFIRTHGYHGPREGLLESRVWREDPAPVVAVAKSYACRAGDAEDIDVTAARRREEQAAALRRLLHGLPRAVHRPARALVRFAAHVPDWRETGRAGLLRSVDVARAASRRLGVCLHAEGVLDAPDDIRFLTIDELAAGGRDGYRALIVQRRADHEAYERMTLPHVWNGLPRTDVVVAPSSGVSSLAGLGVSAGVAEGTVRVIAELSDADITEGTIMVCRATDPSWASLFPLARAVVTDVGSALSHAAIVCRELGLPCVANTRTGTRDLRDGMRVRVDGTAGIVHVLEEESP